MDQQSFEQLKKRFQEVDTKEKIEIYAFTQGLTQEQYKQLLKLFPLEHLPKLEAALR
ncbi:hypothetical protein [Defluviitalea phaphyphila]